MGVNRIGRGREKGSTHLNTTIKYSISLKKKRNILFGRMTKLRN